MQLLNTGLKKRWWPRLKILSAVILIVLMLIYYSKWQNELKKENLTQNINESSFDWQAFNVTAMIYNDNGLIEHELISQQVKHSKDQQLTYYKEPYLRWIEYDIEDKPLPSSWQLISRSAISYHDNNLNDVSKIHFKQDVVVWREPGVKDGVENGFESLETEELWVYPEKEIAHTPLEILWKMDHLTLTGRGLNLYFNESRGEILHDVKSIFIENEQIKQQEDKIDYVNKT